MATHFVWCVALDREVREGLQRKITATLNRWVDLDEKPDKVIVSRAVSDPRDERVSLEIIGESGRLLGAGRMKPPN